MAKLSILAGTTSKLLRVFVPNSSVTTGAGLTGLLFSTSGLTGYYIREGASATTQITLATQTLGTWATGGFIVIDGTNMPGMYEISIPNAAIAAGAKSVVIFYQGAANMAPVILEIELTAVDNQSTAFGLALAKTTNITGFNDIAASAVVSSGAITTSGGAVSSVTTVTTTTTATNLTNAPTAGDFTATMKTSLNSSTPASVTTVTGNVNGSVGSVTGAVGSVTGNVSGTVATVTNLTNAPTAGDFTATMKTSIGTAVAASAVASVTGAVGSLGATAKTDVSTAVLTTAMTESYPTKNSTFSLAQALYNLVQELGERAITSTTVTILKRDQATTAKTYTLNSASNPTSSTEAT